MKKWLSAILSATMVLTLIAIPIISVSAAEETVLDESYDASGWDTKPVVFAKSNVENATSGEYSTVLRPTSLTDAYLVYKFDASSGNVFSALRIEYAGRAIGNAYVNVYASSDNTNWGLIEQMHTAATGDEVDAQTTRIRETSATSVVRGKATAYIKIELITPNVAVASWSSVDYFKVFKQEASSVSPTGTIALGSSVTDHFDSNWQSNANLVESYNLRQGTVGGRSAIYQIDGSRYGYSVYEVNVDSTVTSINFQLNAKVFSNTTNATNSTFWSSVQAYISDSKGGWKSVQLITGPDGDPNWNDSLYTWNISADQFSGRSKYYIMFKIRGCNSSFPDWTFIDKFNVTFGTKLNQSPVSGNGTWLLEGYNEDTWTSQGHLSSYNGIDPALQNVGGEYGVSPTATASSAYSGMGYLTYNFNTNMPFSTFIANVQGRVIGLSDKYGYIEILAAGKDEAWKRVAYYIGNSYDSQLGALTTQNAVDFSSVAAGKTSVYLQISMKASRTDSGLQSWTFLNGLSATSTTSFKKVASATTAATVMLNSDKATALPSTVSVTDVDGGVKTGISVVWDTSTLDTANKGTYTVHGQLVESSLTANSLINLDSVQATAMVTVVDDTNIKLVETAIDGINLDAITAADSAAITAINTQYFALSSAERALVSNISKLNLAMEAIVPVSVYSVIDAGNQRIVYHGGSSFKYYPDLSGKNYGMGGAAIGDYVSIPNVAFGEMGAESLTVAATTRNAGEKLTMYLDNNFSNPVAEFVLPSGNGDNLDLTYAQTVTVSLSTAITGTHTVNLKWTTLTGSVFTVTAEEALINFGSFALKNGIVTGISAGTSIGSFAELISFNENTQIVPMKDGVEFTGEMVVTGLVLSCTLDGKVKEYTLSVSGDLDENGTSDIYDLIVLKNKLLNKTMSWSNAQAAAADLTADGALHINDLLELKSRVI